MSGGIAYVYDPKQQLPARCNADLDGDLLPLTEPSDIATLKGLVQSHLKHTGSQVARQLLLNWQQEEKHFVKVGALGQLQWLKLGALVTDTIPKL